MTLWAGCNATPPPMERPPVTPEEKLRHQLGVPLDAKTVVIFAQTAHLDIDWQKTFDGYYQTWVKDIFLQARQILDEQPRAFYSVAEMGYLKHHVELFPDELPALQADAARGALRIVGGGMTSPDTLLPETEMLMRDYLYGALFAENTLGTTPRAAWLPDSFGHSATAPDILSSAGFQSVMFSRLDGAPTFYEAIKDPANIPPPLPGSNAEMLRGLGSADFVWRGAGGGAVIAHWQDAPTLYCMGDNIDYDELIQLPGGHIGVYQGDQPGFTDGRIDEYIATLQPTSKTPYRFVPVGCDFQSPKEELISYLDGYNKRRYPTTGAWAVAATFEEFAQFLEYHQSDLPELKIDLTPYFMGFYGTRADVKRGVRDAARPFLSAEPYAAALGDGGKSIMTAVQPAFEHLTFADHHDFVTGTANDLVASTEQLPLLDEARAAGQGALGQVAGAIAARLPAPPAGAFARLLALNPSSANISVVEDVALGAHAPPVWHATAGGQPVPLEMLRRSDGEITRTVGARLLLENLSPFSWRTVELFPGPAPGPALAPQVSLQLLDANGQPATAANAARVVLQNSQIRAVWDRANGFALSSLQFGGVESLAGRSFTIGDYTDQGGLWRLGNEMKGCALTPLAPDAGEQAGEQVVVLEQTNLSVRVAFVSSTAVREARLDADAEWLALALTTGAKQGTTRTATINFLAPAGAALRTSQAGGYVDRTVERVYTPTFWPAVGWVTVGSYAVILKQSTGVRFSASGALELMAARDARSEQCDVEGGMGSDPGQHRIEWFVANAGGGAPGDLEIGAQLFNRPVNLIAVAPPAVGATADLALEQSVMQMDGAGVISAIKPADRGDGVIVRAQLMPGPVTLHLSPALVGKELIRTDALERDQADLGVAAKDVVLDPAVYGPIATIRLR